jgi:hypothetical protein
MFKKKNVDSTNKYEPLENMFSVKECRENYFENLDKPTLEKECVNQLVIYDKLINIIDKQRDELNSYVNYYNNEIEKLIDYYNNNIEILTKEIEEYKLKYEELHTYETLSDYYLCNICCVNPKNLIFAPCGHFTTCDSCYFNLVNLSKTNSQIDNNTTGIENNLNSHINNSVIKCPICRKDIDTVKNIFY